MISAFKLASNLVKISSNIKWDDARHRYERAVSHIPQNKFDTITPSSIRGRRNLQISLSGRMPRKDMRFRDPRHADTSQNQHLGYYTMYVPKSKSKSKKSSKKGYYYSYVIPPHTHHEDSSSSSSSSSSSDSDEDDGDSGGGDDNTDGGNGNGTDDGDGDDNDDSGAYSYGRGKCPDEGKTGLACAPDNLADICNKYSDIGSMKACVDACKPSFCCIHDAKNNDKAIPCSDDENCPQYAYCYIVWWKFHDTIGPGIYLRLEQDDDFFDVPASDYQGDQSGDTFMEELIFHFFDNSQEIIDAGTNSEGLFSAKAIFDDPNYWD